MPPSCDFLKDRGSKQNCKEAVSERKTCLVINIPTLAGLPKTGLAVFPYPNLEKQWDPANQMHPTLTLGIHNEAGVRWKTRHPKAVTSVTKIIPIKSRKNNNNNF